jgi:hypothetical protein
MGPAAVAFPIAPVSSGGELCSRRRRRTRILIAAFNHSLVKFKYPDRNRKIHTVMEGATYQQIIGWRVRGNGVEPITVEGVHSISADEAWAIVTPYGTFVEPDIGSWKSAHDWYMAVLDRWQRRKPALVA